MDMALLSRMVRELILVHNHVGLPGVGTFVAEMVPSTFTDMGYTVNPPYRRLTFHPNCLEGSLLASLYARSNGISLDESQSILKAFLNDMNLVLHDRKVLVFPELGRLRMTSGNKVFFIPNEDIDIFPDGFGLEPLSLKTHVETPAELHIAVHNLAWDLKTPTPAPGYTPSFEPDENPAIKVYEEPNEEEAPAPEPTQVPETIPEPETPAAPETILEPETPAVPEIIPEPETPAVPETIPEPETPAAPETISEPETATEPGPEPQPEPEPSKAPVPGPASTTDSKPRPFRWWIVPLSIVAVALLALVAFWAVAHISPGIFDNLLYTPEELKIING